MQFAIFNRPEFLALALLALAAPAPAHAGLLSASYNAVPQGSNVNLTVIGSMDWVHWGLYTDSSVNRKAGVLNLISDFTLVGATSNSYPFAWQYADNFNGYSWTDGDPELRVDYTTTGVWAYDTPVLGSGFQLTVPADTQPKTFKVFVGSYAGRGRFRASLSDSSAPAYSNNSVFNMRNGPGGVYTLQYAANSPGETLTVTYTLENLFAPDANVTLQAATLSAAGGNNPPVVTITNPSPGANVPAGSSLTLRANASDPDGSVTKVEFFSGETKLGESTATPFEVSWPSIPPGRHVVHAVATDNGGETSQSRSVELFAYTTGGSLAGNMATPPSSVHLTTEGSGDWVHWGLTPSNSVNRKTGIAPQISSLTFLGTGPWQVYSNNFTAFAWSDGSPTPSASGIRQGIYITGVTNGFEFTTPADSSPRQLKVYVGLYGASSRIQAHLSDFSAPAYRDQSLTNVFGNSYAVYTFNYAAASPGQHLVVRYQTVQLYDLNYGNVTLQAATLVGNPAPVPVTLANPAFQNGAFRFSFLSESNRTYTILHVPALDGGIWNSNASVSGTGGWITITNPPRGTSNGFFQILTE